MENDMKPQKVTAAECVLALKTFSKGGKAKDIAFVLNTDSRNVATALRKPTHDGRVKLGWDKKTGVAVYKYIRSTPAKVKGGAA